jgi:hypothetical protein
MRHNDLDDMPQQGSVNRDHDTRYHRKNTNVNIGGFTLKVGDDTNNLTVEKDGTIVFNGTTTVWEDYVTPINRATFGGASNDPAPTKLFDDGAGSAGIWALVFSNGDEVIITAQLPHSWKVGSTIYPHIHFMTTSDVSPSDNFGIEFEYSWVDRDGDFPANTTLTTIDIPTGVNTNNMHQLGNITVAGVDGSGHNMESLLLIRIKRIAADADDYGDGVAIMDFDIHYEKDTVGSKTISTK